MTKSTVGTPKSPEQIQHDWDHNPRWKGITRTYTPKDVVALQGTVVEEATLARRGAEVLWEQLHEMDFVNSLGALTGNMAVQQVRAGLEAIYLSGWQVAGDANLSGHTYPDQSLYPANSVPSVVQRINNALLRADQIEHSEGIKTVDEWVVPIVADAEAGFGGPLNAYELMKAMIAAGASGVHWEDQLASEKKCGHLGGKVLIPTQQHIRTLNAARLAADVEGVLIVNGEEYPRSLTVSVTIYPPAADDVRVANALGDMDRIAELLGPEIAAQVDWAGDADREYTVTEIVDISLQ